MNFNNLVIWSTGIITALAGVHNIDAIQRGILKAQARLVYESRTETWGSPKFLITEQKPRMQHQKRARN